MARENRDWGFRRLRGALGNLGYEYAKSTIANILKKARTGARADVDPASPNYLHILHSSARLSPVTVMVGPIIRITVVGLTNSITIPYITLFSLLTMLPSQSQPPIFPSTPMPLSSMQIHPTMCSAILNS
jgi:hypothetical protein